MIRTTHAKTVAVLCLLLCAGTLLGGCAAPVDTQSAATPENDDTKWMGADNYRVQEEIGTRSWHEKKLTDADVAWLVAFSQHGAALPSDAFSVSRVRVCAFLLLRQVELTPSQKEVVRDAVLPVASGSPEQYAQTDRASAINVLHKIGDDRAAMYAAPFLQDPDPYVRKFAERIISAPRR